MKLKFLLVLLAIAAHFSGCATAPKHKHDAPSRLNGMVYDGDSQPVPSVRVRIDDERTATSDVNGRFFLIGLEPGTYQVSAEKDGFESMKVKLEYSGPSQILYIKIHSAEQLLGMAEKALEKKNWNECQALLQRTRTIDPNDTSAQYLTAVLFFRKGEYENSKEELEGILKDGGVYPFVHLFLADLFQYKVERPEAALAHLEKFLDSRYDPDIDKRRNELRKGSGDSE